MQNVKRLEEFFKRETVQTWEAEFHVSNIRMHKHYFHSSGERSRVFRQGEHLVLFHPNKTMWDHERGIHRPALDVPKSADCHSQRRRSRRDRKDHLPLRGKGRR